MSGPPKRRGETFRFVINSRAEGEFEGYITINSWEGQPREIFLSSAKQGSFVHGMMDAVAILVSRSLQAGVPLHNVCWSLMGLRFEPRGSTDDHDVPEVESLCDYVGRKLATYLPAEERERLNNQIRKENVNV